MIAPLLEAAARRAAQADLVLKTDETTTVRMASGRAGSAEICLTQGLSLRVVVDGRVGVAGSVDDDPAGLLDQALAAARAGEHAALTLPRSAPLPSVLTHMPRAAAATVSDLLTLAAQVRDRLMGDRLDLDVTVERSLGSVRTANTAGADAAYDVSLVTLAVVAARVRDGRRLVFRHQLAGADLPELSQVERLVGTVRQRLGWSERDAEAPGGRRRVCFLPAAQAVLFRPVEQALVGRDAMQGVSPLARRRGARVLSPLLSLSDEPLLDGRPGSRPVDDEAIPCHPLALIAAGTIAAFVYDLETAGRTGAQPTGHGRRSLYGKPQAGYANLVVATGAAPWEALLGDSEDGIVVEQLRGEGQGNVVGGTFAAPAALAWRVQGGEIAGLVPEVTVAGNAYDLLGRLVSLGREPDWIGARSAPPMVVDGVSLF